MINDLTTNVFLPCLNTFNRLTHQPYVYSHKILNTDDYETDSDEDTTSTTLDEKSSDENNKEITQTNVDEVPKPLDVVPTSTVEETETKEQETNVEETSINNVEITEDVMTEDEEEILEKELNNFEFISNQSKKVILVDENVDN
jgi:hypothetical protein